MSNPFQRFGGSASLIRSVSRDRSLAGWVVGRAPEVGYLGWVNQGNVGDELMLMAHKQIMTGTRIAALPLLGPSRRVLALRHAHAQTILLGGGTLVGLDGWAKRLRSVLESVRHDRLVVFGPGVEERGFGAHAARVTDEGISMWRALLEEAEYIGVRGPRSQEALASLGIPSEVVGDPALCVPLRRQASDADSRPVLSINLTDVNVTLDGVSGWRDVLAQSAAQLARTGYTLAAFGMDQGDTEATIRRLAAHGADPDRIVAHHRIDGVLDLLRSSTLVISERLHGAISAANIGVPFIHLGYRPKAYDFAESIGAERFVVGSGRPTTEAVSRLVESALSERSQPSWTSALDALRRKFFSEHRRVFSSLDS